MNFAHVEMLCHQMRTYRRGVDKHWFSTLYSDAGFGHAKCICETHAEAVIEQKHLRLEVMQPILRNLIPLFCQAPHSLDMANCDCWLFPKLKISLNGTQFES